MNLVSKIAIVLAMLASFGASAQKLGALRGTVRDAETGEGGTGGAHARQ